MQLYKFKFGTNQNTNKTKQIFNPKQTLNHTLLVAHSPTYPTLSQKTRLF